jgi:hypothetical protein
MLVFILLLMRFMQSILISSPQIVPPLVQLAAVGRQVKSSFTEGAGKHKVIKSTAVTMPAAKKRATMGVTPGTFTNDPVPSHPSTPTKMLINQDINPPHMYNWMSILQLIYKHHPPKDIVRLMAGDKLIVVIPVFGKTKSPDHAVHVHCSYTQVFENIINDTLRWLHPGY